MRGSIRIVALGLAAAGAAEAQTPAQPSGPAADYPGVVPGAGHLPPAARQAARGARNVLTWPGLEVTAAGSRIFVQSTAAPSWSRSDADNRIVIRIRNARIHLSNNLNPLVATHFDTTPVASARLVRRGRDIELVVELKARAAASVRVEAGADRYHYLFVEFPPGTYLVPASDLPAGETTDRPTVDIGGDAGIRRGRTR
ncbi:MAG: hypothetical protein QME96_16100 [Myxococcota bacterium]|nr:hypothetical protein [Myxococcota bacterium]